MDRIIEAPSTEHIYVSVSVISEVPHSEMSGTCSPRYTSFSGQNFYDYKDFFAGSDWASSGLIVDVGGGKGPPAMLISTMIVWEHLLLPLVIQDREQR